MKYYIPLHEVLDNGKLGSMIESLRQGKSLPPVVVCGDVALTGTHRLAAYRIASERSNALLDGWEEFDEASLPVVEISDDEYQAAVEADDGTDSFNSLCRALYETCDREDVRAALKDQID